MVYSQANVLLEHWKQSHTQNAYSEIIFNISNAVLLTQSSLLIFSIVHMHLYFIPLEVPFDSFSKEAASVTLVKPWMLHDSGLSCSQLERLILCSLLTLSWHHQTCLWSHHENMQVGFWYDRKEQVILEKQLIVVMCYNVSSTIFYSVWGDKSLSKFVDIIFGNLILIPIYHVEKVWGVPTVMKKL